MSLPTITSIRNGLFARWRRKMSSDDPCGCSLVSRQHAVQIARVSGVRGRVEQGVTQNLLGGKAVVVDAAVPAPATGPGRRGTGFVQFVSERLL